MNKKGQKKSSSIENRKFHKSTIISNNKKATRSKPRLIITRSVEKKKIFGITTEPRVNVYRQPKADNKKFILLSKQKKNNVLNSRANKGKEYNNNLNKLTVDNDYDRDYNFFNIKFSNDDKKKVKDDKNKTSKNDEDIKKNNRLVSFKDNKSEGGKKSKTIHQDDSSDEEDSESEKDDFLHRPFYQPTIDFKIIRSDDKKEEKEKEKEKEKVGREKSKEKLREKEKEKNKEMQKKSHLSLHKSKEKLTISMEKTDDMHYNIEDKKIYSNQSKTGAGYTNTEANDKYKKATNLVNERTVDIFVIDGEEDAVVSTKNKKKINRKRNKLIEVIIEKYDSSTPVRVEKFTGFILARRSKGKKIYEYQLEDNIDKANSILKNNDVKLKGEIIMMLN